MSARGARILAEGDARELLAYVSEGWPGSRERLYRLPYYAAFVERLLAAEESPAGALDAMLHEAARLFGCSLGSIRKDLRAASDLRRLERIHKLPPRPPRPSTP